MLRFFEKSFLNYPYLDLIHLVSDLLQDSYWYLYVIFLLYTSLGLQVNGPTSKGSVFLNIIDYTMMTQ